MASRNLTREFRLDRSISCPTPIHYSYQLVGGGDRSHRIPLGDGNGNGSENGLRESGLGVSEVTDQSNNNKRVVSARNVRNVKTTVTFVRLICAVRENSSSAERAAGFDYVVRRT